MAAIVGGRWIRDEAIFKILPEMRAVVQMTSGVVQEQLGISTKLTETLTIETS